jgi:CheY-like chemotaxis protein
VRLRLLPIPLKSPPARHRPCITTEHWTLPEARGGEPERHQGPVAQLEVRLGGRRERSFPGSSDRVPAQSAPHRLRLLIVEDDERFAGAMLTILQDRFEVHRVSGSKEADAVLPIVSPDVLWLDLDLPRAFGPSSGLEGISFLRHLRSTPTGKALPVIVVSGQYGPDLDEELNDLRVAARFGKPPELAALLICLEAFRQAGGSSQL